MVGNNSQPSRNPSNSSGDMAGGMREILAKFLQSSIDDMLPAKIISYDRDKNRATVKILMAMIKTSGETVSRNQLASIPVLNIGGGGFILSFNFTPGDLGWIKANDRDIADFLKTYSESAPSTKRIHDFSNGVFIPDVMTGYNIAGEDKENAVFQTLDGSVRVSLFPDKIKLSAPLIEIDGPVEMRDTLLVDGAIEAKSTVEIDDLLTVNNGILIGGSVKSQGGGPLVIDADIETTGETDLGGTGGPAIARVGDSVSGGGVITSGSSKSRAT